jgi:hypothetical protein
MLCLTLDSVHLQAHHTRLPSSARTRTWSASRVRGRRCKHHQPSLQPRALLHHKGPKACPKTALPVATWPQHTTLDPVLNPTPLSSQPPLGLPLAKYPSVHCTEAFAHTVQITPEHPAPISPGVPHSCQLHPSGPLVLQAQQLAVRKLRASPPNMCRIFRAPPPGHPEMTWTWTKTTGLMWTWICSTQE